MNGTVLWANLFLLFWMSLVPFVIRWIDETGFQPLPTAAYGAVLAGAAIGYLLLEWALVACNGPQSRLCDGGGHDRKGLVSLTLYIAAIALAFVHPWIAIAIYVGVVARLVPA